MDKLTPREREIVAEALHGKGAKDIGAALNLSPGTVNVHLHRIYVKLGISGTGAARQLILRQEELLGAERA